MPRFCCADISTVIVSPPHASGTSPCSASWFSTRCGSALSLSILLMATMIGTSAARAWSMASIVWGITPSSAATTSTTMSVTCAPRARILVNAAWPGVSMNVICVAVPLDLVGADVLGDAAGLAGDDVGGADLVEQRGLAVVDVAHDGDDRRRGRLHLGVLVVVVVEEGLELHLLLLTRLDEQDVGADLEGEELHLLVGQRHGGGDHLALLEQEAHDVGRRAVQLGRELLGRRAPLDDDRALGHGRVVRRVARQQLLRLQLLAVATATAAAPALRWPTATAAGTTAGTTGTPRTAGTAAGATTGAAPPGRRPGGRRRDRRADRRAGRPAPGGYRARRCGRRTAGAPADGVGGRGHRAAAGSAGRSGRRGGHRAGGGIGLPDADSGPAGRRAAPGGRAGVGRAGRRCRDGPAGRRPGTGAGRGPAGRRAPGARPGADAARGSTAWRLEMMRCSASCASVERADVGGAAGASTAAGSTGPAPAATVAEAPPAAGATPASTGFVAARRRGRAATGGSATFAGRLRDLATGSTGAGRDEAVTSTTAPARAPSVATARATVRARRPSRPRAFLGPLGGAGSSGCSARTSPSRSARRRTRSP